jgi:PTH2 family peptidyl-tRNA hydrolase
MIKQVIVMRKDLSMNKGKMIAQGAHASMDAFLSLMNLENTEFGTEKNILVIRGQFKESSPMAVWLRGTYTKVCVGVNSEEALLDLFEAATAADLPRALITDSGKTVFHGEPTNTCIAIGPAEAELIDKITGHLNLI